MGGPRALLPIARLHAVLVLALVHGAIWKLHAAKTVARLGPMGADEVTTSCGATAPRPAPLTVLRIHIDAVVTFTATFTAAAALALALALALAAGRQAIVDLVAALWRVGGGECLVEW